MRENEVEKYIREHLRRNGWAVKPRKNKFGIDIEAIKDNRKAIIEVKGCGAHTTAMSNNFNNVFGQILKDMQDKNAEYYVAFPHIQPYIRLWEGIPDLAKNRISVNVIWVDANGVTTGI